MQRDGRSFDHRTLEAIRLMAIERVREGELPSAVIASYGFCRTTIYKWIRAGSLRCSPFRSCAGVVLLEVAEFIEHDENCLAGIVETEG